MTLAQNSLAFVACGIAELRFHTHLLDIGTPSSINELVLHVFQVPDSTHRPDGRCRALLLSAV